LKSFNCAPLPFQGQKRRFVNEFKEALKGFENVSVVVDLFGGSGLLSHAAKEALPHARVIYNDYDGYSERLANIARTNAILSDLRAIVGNYPREKKLTPEMKEKALSRIKQESGFVDYITLSSSLVFSMNYALGFEDLEKETLYNNVRKSDFPIPDGYLAGVETVRLDYRELWERWRGYPGVVFLVDPPYLSTDVGTYMNYWRLSNYLDVLTVLAHDSYFYFTSNKSSILELFEWLEKNTNLDSPFVGATMKTTSNQLTYNAKYVDMMLYREW
jgi:site-specific DNA-adenine methylase